MLYLLGGASRGGKSRLARRLLAGRGVPSLHLDLLMMGFAKGLPGLGVDPETPAAVRGARMWPVVRAMAVTAIEDGVDCLFEGDLLLPEHAADLRDAHGEEVRAAFLGYAEVDARRKLREIRSFGGGPNDWLSDLPDQRVLEIVATNTRLSLRLKDECAALDLPYFDTSHDFFGGLDAAFAHLSRP